MRNNMNMNYNKHNQFSKPHNMRNIMSGKQFSLNNTTRNNSFKQNTNSNFKTRAVSPINHNSLRQNIGTRGQKFAFNTSKSNNPFKSNLKINQRNKPFNFNPRGMSQMGNSLRPTSLGINNSMSGMGNAFNKSAFKAKNINSFSNRRANPNFSNCNSKHTFQQSYQQSISTSSNVGRSNPFRGNSMSMMGQPTSFNNSFRKNPFNANMNFRPAYGKNMSMNNNNSMRKINSRTPQMKQLRNNTSFARHY